MNKIGNRFEVIQMVKKDKVTYDDEDEDDFEDDDEDTDEDMPDSEEFAIGYCS